jgi:uncharacterized SAM-binding protein YcdF (DUF218 family)
MTTPNMDDRVAEGREPEIYPSPREVATSRGATARRRALNGMEGAVLGVAFWLVLVVLGFPWVLHLEGLEGVLPCLVLGAALGWAGWRVVPMGGLAAVCLLLVVVAYTPIIVGPARSLIRDDPLPAKADAVMALSAGVNDYGTISARARDNLIKAMELVNRGIAPILVVSREAYIIDGKLVTSRRDQERTIALTPGGLSKLVVAGVTHSTHDEAMRARELFRARNWKRIVVVTSPMHTRRACATFEKAGLVVSCAASNTKSLAVGTLSSPEDRVAAFQAWLYELAGTLRYRQLGWL